jgi:transposase
MSKKKLKVYADLSIIKSQLRKDEKFSQGIRLHAVYQIAKGVDAKDLQKLYSSSHKSICNWVHRYNAEGIEGLKDRPRSGRTPSLNAAQKAELKQILQNTPDTYQYNTSTWTAAIVLDIIKNRFGVEYKKSNIYNILRALGLSYQKGKGYFPEAAERAEKVVAIKKTPNHR